jgi:predicted DCC family thiol-disulfide oxidoreductase YuxK
MNATTKPCLPLTVYYDKSCPLCAIEMHALRDLDPGRLNLVDCSAQDFDDKPLACHGVTRQALMTRIHARDAQGRWLIGLDAFEAVYAAAGLKGVARFWGNRRLRPVLDRIYPWIARHRQALSRLGLHRVIGALLACAGSRAGYEPKRLA